MIIESVQINNYRSIFNEFFLCERLTALVGANGSGKSSFLHALELFYTNIPKIDIEDFYNKDSSKEISIGITFKDLSKEAKEQFSSYLQNEKLTIERVIRIENGKVLAKYHGSTLQNPDFQGVREAFQIRDRGKAAQVIYESLGASSKYITLPGWTKKLEDNQNALKQWEIEHPTECIRARDEGQFFGFNEVGRGYLGRYTRFLFIPAVRDAAADASEGKGSVLTVLMDFIVRSVLHNREEVKKLRESTQEEYEKIMNPQQIAELSNLASQMTKTLNEFIPDSKIELSWLPLHEVDIPLPEAEVKLIEDGYSSSVTRTGHGLQRAFILTILQYLVFAQIQPSVSKKEDSQFSASSPEQQHEKSSTINSEGTEESKFPDLVLAIEEPELYQHPNRQRHFSKVLMQLSQGKTPGVADKTQIIYCTHSPLFVGIDRINEIRLLKKINNGENKPKITKVVHTNLDIISEKMCHVYNEPIGSYTSSKLLPRLKTIMTPWMNEGFFSDVVVLVEGEDDRAAILGVAHSMGLDLEAQGYSIIPCGGKTNLDRPYLIFSALSLPVYVIWDGDYGKGETEGICEKCRRPLDKKPNPQENIRLLRLIEYGEEINWPDFVSTKAACFKKDLETTIKEEIGSELYEQILSECQAEFSIPERRNAQKNPLVITSLIKKAEDNRKTCGKIKNIVQTIVALKG